MTSAVSVGTYPPESRPGARARIGWSRLAWAAFFFTVIAGAWILGDPEAGRLDVVSGVSLLLGVSAVATIGALLVTRGQAPVPGILLLSFAVFWSIGRSAYHSLELMNRDGDVADKGGPILVTVGDTGYVLAIYALLALLVVVPDGRLPSRRWRPLVWVLGVSALFWCVQSAWLSTTVVDYDRWLARSNPLSTAGAELSPWLTAVTDGGAIISTATLVLVAGALVQRYRSAPGEERRQLGWVFVGAAVVLGWLVLWLPQPESDLARAGQSLIPGLAHVTLAATFGIALFRHRVWDVDVVVRRSFVYGILWLAIAATYFVVAAGLGLAATSRLPIELAIAMTVLVTVAFQPARNRLEGVADRWVFGRRSSPAEVLQSFGEVIVETERADQVATELAELAVRSIGLAWVRVEIDGSTPVVMGCEDDSPVTRVPIVWGDESWGRMECRARRGETIDPEEGALLSALATQAALAISHARLAKRIVQAQAAERRRIERNIHDGAQQDLATLIAQLGLARSRANGDDELKELLEGIQGGVRRTLAEIRTLAQGIHPTVLSDGGLVVAIEDRCTQLPLDVSLRVMPSQRAHRYPSDIEAAAYFTVVEALTNVVKHARTSAVDVEVREVDGGRLRVAVADSGRGFDPAAPTPGSGLAGLADRVRALGGELLIDAGPTTGTVVAATFPGAWGP